MAYQDFRNYRAQAQLQVKIVNADLAEFRTQVSADLVKTNRVMVALTFGQANSANLGESPKTAQGEVFNFYDGKIYRAEDPLIGTTGDGGSVGLSRPIMLSNINYMTPWSLRL